MSEAFGGSPVKERHVLEEMRNILKNQPLWPGDTVAHSSANECVRRGLAVRTVHGSFVATAAGRSYVEEFNACEGGRDGNTRG